MFTGASRGAVNLGTSIQKGDDFDTDQDRSIIELGPRSSVCVYDQGAKYGFMLYTN